jgi:tripartite-type tricarboxylate transporter receptor subunit TctC
VRSLSKPLRKPSIAPWFTTAIRFVTTQPHIRDGKLKVIGVTSLKLLNFLPEVPTLDEQGLKGFDVSNWFGIYAPRGIPVEIIQKINAAFNQALQDPDVLRRYQNLGASPMSGTPEYMVKVVAADTIKWRKLIQDQKIKVE